MKRISKILTAIVVIIMLVYAASPLWIPTLIRSQLPPGWRLAAVDTSYPGASSIEIKNLQLATVLAGRQITVTAGPGEVYYSGEQVDLSSLSVEVTPATNDEHSEPFAWQDLSIPLLVFPGNVPEVSVGELELDLAFAVPGLQFHDVELSAGAGGSQMFGATFTASDLDSIHGRIEAILSAGRLEADIVIVNADEDAILEVGLLQQGEADKSGSEITASVFLGVPEIHTLYGALLPEGPKLPGGLSGNLQAKAEFGGPQQILQNIHVATPGVSLQLENESFSAAFGLVVEVTQQKVLLSSILPIDIQYEGQTDRLSHLLNDLIPELSTDESEAAGHRNIATLGIAVGSRLETELDDWRQASFTGSADLELNTPAIRVESMAFSGLQFRSVDLEKLEISQLTGEVELSAAAKVPFSYAVDDSMLRADSMSLGSLGQLQINDGVVRYETSEPVSAQLDNMTLLVAADDGSDPLAVVSGEVTLETMLVSDAGSVTTSGSGTLSGSRIDSVGISADQVFLQWNELDLDNRSGTFQVSTDGLGLAIEDEHYRDIEPDIDCGLSGNGDMSCKGVAVVGSTVSLPLGISGSIDTQVWQVRVLPVEIAASDGPVLLSAINLSVPEIIQVSEGAINLQVNATYDSDLRGSAQVEGASINFNAAKSEAEDFSFTFNGDIGAEVSANGHVSLQHALLAAGLVMDSLEADILVDGEDNIVISSVHAGIFNGNLSMERLQILDGVVQDSLVTMSAADLTAILEFAAISGLDGGGSLELSLPLSSDSKGVFIKDGAFSTNAPGIISYDAADPAIVEDNIGLQALQNFHYSALDGSINYSSEGEYRLLVHLAGNNPDLYDGYPIELNLNIGGTLPELFEVLFLTGDFEEAILERIRIK